MTKYMHTYQNDNGLYFESIKYFRVSEKLDKQPLQACVATNSFLFLWVSSNIAIREKPTKDHFSPFKMLLERGR